MRLRDDFFAELDSHGLSTDAEQSATSSGRTGESVGMNDEDSPITTVSGARAAGSHSSELARAVRRGQLVRLRRGAYADANSIAKLDGPANQQLLVRAARIAARHEPVFSHESAAALLGIPILGKWPDRVHTTVDLSGGSSSAAVMRTQRSLSPDDVITLPDGSQTTSLARTAVDLAAISSLLSGIVAMSHVRAAGVALAELEHTAERIGPITGIGRVRRAMARSTDGSESVLETLVVTRCQDYGFEPPEQQRRVIGVDGLEYRVDFAWLDGRVLGEADGRAKYRDTAYLNGRMPEQVLWDEKRREDALRPQCDRFFRAIWSDAWSGASLARRLEAVGVPRTGRRLGALTF